eukprot:1580876-Amphidinium_carterae.2
MPYNNFNKQVATMHCNRLWFSLDVVVLWSSSVALLCKEQNKATDLFLYADSVVDSKLRSQASQQLVLYIEQLPTLAFPQHVPKSRCGKSM